MVGRWIGRHGGAVVQHREDQVLEGDGDFLAVAGQQRQCGGQPPAGAFAADDDAAPIHVQRVGLAVQPRQGGVAVLDRSGMRRLRRQTVGDGHHHRAEGGDVGRVRGLAHLRRAHDITAAVDMQDRGSVRAGRPGRRDEDPDLRRPRRSGNAALGDLDLGRRRRAVGLAHGQHHGAGGGQARGIELEPGKLLDQGHDLGIDKVSRRHVAILRRLLT